MFNHGISDLFAQFSDSDMGIDNDELKIIMVCVD